MCQLRCDASKAQRLRGEVVDYLASWCASMALAEKRDMVFTLNETSPGGAEQIMGMTKTLSELP